MQRWALAFLFLASRTLAAQGLEPGEWEFNAVTTSPLVTGGQAPLLSSAEQGTRG